MKRFYVIFLFFIIFSGNLEAKDTVAVMDFENKTRDGGYEIGRGASDMLTTELVKTGKFNVMERGKMASILKEQNLGQSGLVDAATASKIGKLIGASYIITGAVTEYGESEQGGQGGGVEIKRKGYSATVDVRMVNVNTGQINFADSSTKSLSSFGLNILGYSAGEGFNNKKASEALRESIKDIALKIDLAQLEKIDTASVKSSSSNNSNNIENALIADIEGNNVTINKGKNAGFTVGQDIYVYRQGKVIKDPKTGAVIKTKLDKIGSIKLTSVEDSVAEGKIMSGSNFQVGDQCK